MYAMKSQDDTCNIGRKNCRAIFIGCLILVGGCDSVWTPIDPVGRIDPTPQAIQLRSQTVEFKLSRLTPPFNGRIKLDLPGGESIVARLTKYEEFGDESFVWRGRIKGPNGGFVMFSAVRGALIGTISMANGRLFYIRSVEDDAALVEELDPKQFPREEAVLTPMSSQPGIPGGAVVDSGVIAFPGPIEL